MSDAKYQRAGGGVNDSRKLQMAYAAAKNMSFHGSPDKALSNKYTGAAGHKNQQSFVSSQLASKDAHLNGGSTSSTRKTTNTTVTGIGTGHSAQQNSFSGNGGIHSLSTTTVQQTTNQKSSHNKRQAHSHLITQKGQPDELVNRGNSLSKFVDKDIIKTPGSRGNALNGGKTIRNVPTSDIADQVNIRLKSKNNKLNTSSQLSQFGLPSSPDKKFSEDAISPLKKLIRGDDGAARKNRKREPKALASGIVSNTLHRRRKQDNVAEDYYGEETDPAQGSFSRAAGDLLERTAEAELSLSRGSLEGSPDPLMRADGPSNSGAAPDASASMALSDDDSPLGGPEQERIERAREKANKEREHKFRKLFKVKFGVSRVPQLPLIDSEKDETSYFKDHYDYKRFLGAGSFGFVVEGTCRSTGEHLAIKIVERKYEESIHSLNAEAEILASLSGCPHVIQFKHLKVFQNFVIMGIEYAQGGALSDLMTERIRQRKHLKDEDCARLVKAILLGLKHCHKNDYVHRDLKPSNVVLADRADLETARLIDFGLAVKFETRQGMEESCGTLAYQAPEQMAGGQLYGKAVDIWAVGLIMYELIAARHPIWTTGLDKAAYKKKALAFQKIEFSSRRFNKFSRNLIDKLCHPKPSLRYTADQALQHPWITRDFAGGGQIPRTAFEHGEFVNEIEDKLRKMMNLMFFVSVVKNHKEVKAEQEQRRKQPQAQPVQKSQRIKKVLDLIDKEKDTSPAQTKQLATINEKQQRSAEKKEESGEEGLLRQVTPCFDGLILGSQRSHNSPQKDLQKKESQEIFVPESAMDQILKNFPDGDRSTSDPERLKRISNVSDVLAKTDMAQLLQAEQTGSSKDYRVRAESLLPMSDTSQERKGTTTDASPGAYELVTPTEIEKSGNDDPKLNETLVPKDSSELITLNPSPETQQRKERDQKTQRAFKISKSVSRKAFEASKARKLRSHIISNDGAKQPAQEADKKQGQSEKLGGSNKNTEPPSATGNKSIAEVKALLASRGPIIDNSQGKITIPASKVTKASIEQQRSLGQFGPLKVETQSLERQSLNSVAKPASKMPMTQTNMSGVSRVEVGSGHSRRHNGSQSGWSEKRKIKAGKFAAPSPLMNVSPKLEGSGTDTITLGQYPAHGKVGGARVPGDSSGFYDRSLVQSLHQTINADVSVRESDKRVQGRVVDSTIPRRQQSIDNKNMEAKKFCGQVQSKLQRVPVKRRLTPKRIDSRNVAAGWTSTSQNIVPQSTVSRCKTGCSDARSSARFELGESLKNHTPFKVEVAHGLKADINKIPQKSITTQDNIDKLQEKDDDQSETRSKQVAATPKGKFDQRVKKRKRDSVGQYNNNIPKDFNAARSSVVREPTVRVASRSAIRAKSRRLTRANADLVGTTATSDQRKIEPLFDNAVAVEDKTKQDERQVTVADMQGPSQLECRNELLLDDDKDSIKDQMPYQAQNTGNLVRANTIRREGVLNRAPSEFASLKLRRKLSTQINEINSAQMTVADPTSAAVLAVKQRTYEDMIPSDRLSQYHALSGPSLTQENLPALAHGVMTRGDQSLRHDGAGLPTTSASGSASNMKMALSQPRKTTKPQLTYKDEVGNSSAIKKTTTQPFAGGFDIIRHTTQPTQNGRGALPPNVTVLSQQIGGLGTHHAAIHIYESNGGAGQGGGTGPAYNLQVGTLKRFQMLEPSPQARAHTELKGKASYGGKNTTISSLIPAQQQQLSSTVVNSSMKYASHTGKRVSPQYLDQSLIQDGQLQRTNTFSVGATGDVHRIAQDQMLIEQKQLNQLTDQVIRQSLGSGNLFSKQMKYGASSPTKATQLGIQETLATINKDGRPSQYKSATVAHLDQHLDDQRRRATSLESQTNLGTYNSTVSHMVSDTRVNSGSSLPKNMAARVNHASASNSLHIQQQVDQKMIYSNKGNVYQQGLPMSIHNQSAQASSNSLSNAQRAALLKQPSMILKNQSGQRFSNFTNSFHVDDDKDGPPSIKLQSNSNSSFMATLNPQQIGSAGAYGQNSIPMRQNDAQYEPRIRDSNNSSNIISQRVQLANKRHGYTQQDRWQNNNNARSSARKEQQQQQENVGSLQPSIVRFS